MTPLKELGFKVLTDVTIEDVNNWVEAHGPGDKELLSTVDKPIPHKRHTRAADDLAFDRLWEERQEIVEIVQRAIREGQSDNGRGYKKIRAVLERVE